MEANWKLNGNQLAAKWKSIGNQLETKWKPTEKLNENQLVNKSIPTVN